MNFEIYLVGGIDFLAPIFRGLVILLGGNPIESFVKLNVLLGLLFAIWMSIFGREKFFFARYFLMAIIILNLFFSPIANITLVDTKYQKTEVIQNFPFGPAFILSLASNSSDFLTQAIDNLFHSGTTIVWNSAYGSYITDLDYKQNGFAGVFLQMKKVLSHNFKDAPEYANLFDMAYAYMEQCFIPYLLSEKVNNPSNYQDILKEPDLYGSGKLRVQGFLIDWQNQVYSCNDFYDNVLSPKIQDFKNAISNNPELAGFNFYEVLIFSGIVQTLTLANYNFATAVSQSGLINALRYVVSTKDVESYNVLAAYVAGRTLERQKMTFLAMGEYASEMLPKLRNYLIAIAVFFSFLLIPLILIPSFGGPSPGLPVWGFVKYIIWTFLWDPMLALLDAGMKIYAIQKATSWLVLNNATGISILTHVQLLDDMSWYPAIAGYIGAVMVPSLSWMFVRGFEATATAIAYMFSHSSAAVSTEAQNVVRNVEREKFARMVGFKNAGEMDYLGEMYNAMYHGTSIKSYYDYETSHGTREMVDKFYTQHSVNLQQQFGVAQGKQRFANDFFGGDVEQAAIYMTQMGETQKFGDLKAFENFTKVRGFNDYVLTRTVELLNESAKMNQKIEAAELMGYVKNARNLQEFLTGVFQYLIDRHRSDNQVVVSATNREALALLFEAAGMKSVAQSIREGKYDGAIVNFGYTVNEEGKKVGFLKLQKGNEVYEFKKEIEEDVKKDVYERISESRIATIRENVYIDTSRVDLGNLAVQSPDVATRKVFKFLQDFLNSYGAIDEYGRITSYTRLNQALQSWKQAMFEQISNNIEKFISIDRKEGISKRLETSTNFSLGQDVIKGIVDRLKGNPNAERILTKLGFSSGQANALIQGDYSVLTSVDDSTLKKFISYFVDSELDSVIKNIKTSAQDGKLTSDEIYRASNRLVNDVQGVVKAHGDFSQKDAGDLGARHFQTLKEDNAAFLAGLTALAFSSLGPYAIELGAKGIGKLGSKLKDLIKGTEGQKVIEELGEEILEKTKAQLGRKEAAKFTDDFFKSVYKTMEDMKVKGMEAIEYAKDEFTRMLASKGISIDKAERIFNEIKDAVIKNVDDLAKSGRINKALGILGGVAGGIVGELLMPNMAFAPELPQKPQDAGLDIKNGHFVIKNPELFKMNVMVLGLSEKDYDLETGRITKEGEQKIINYFSRFSSP